MRLTSAILLVGLVSISVVRVTAHHAVSAVFDERRAVTIEGTVDRIVNRNPHPWVDLVVEGRKGWNGTWAVEFDAASHLARRPGRIVLRPGDRITVCGNPGRDAGQYRLRMLMLERPSDGYQIITSVGLIGARCDR